MNIKLFFKRNSSMMLTVLGCVGVVATGILSARAASKKEHDKSKNIVVTYMPAVLTGTATIMCICGSQFLNHNQQASMVSAYALLDQSYRDYRRKLKEIYGEDADHRIITALAVETAEKVHINSTYLCGDCDLSLDKSANKTVLFYEEISKRFFESTIEQVLQAEYHLNRNYTLRGFAVLNELYSFLGLPDINGGDELGWAPTDEGEYWIEFNHRRAMLDDETEYYSIEMPFEPRVNYDDYYDSEEEYYANR